METKYPSSFAASLIAITRSRQACVKWFDVAVTSSLPSRSQSKPSKGRGSASFHAFHVPYHSRPSHAVTGCGASQPPMEIKCVVGRSANSNASATDLTHS